MIGTPNKITVREKTCTTSNWKIRSPSVNVIMSLPTQSIFDGKIGQFEAMNEVILRERYRVLDLANNFQKPLTTSVIGQHHRLVNVD